MAPAVDVLERLVGEGKLRHGGHPVLTMAASNAKVELDAAGNRKLSKLKSTGRIDPLVALAMALGVAARHESAQVWGRSWRWSSAPSLHNEGCTCRNRLWCGGKPRHRRDSIRTSDKARSHRRLPRTEKLCNVLANHPIRCSL
jgi:hypothetical protein